MTIRERLALAMCKIEKRRTCRDIDEAFREVDRCWRRHIPEAEVLMAELNGDELEIRERDAAAERATACNCLKNRCDDDPHWPSCPMHHENLQKRK